MCIAPATTVRFKPTSAVEPSSSNHKQSKLQAAYFVKLAEIQ
jgi:hypothetical protein